MISTDEEIAGREIIRPGLHYYGPGKKKAVGFAGLSGAVVVVKDMGIGDDALGLRKLMDGLQDGLQSLELREQVMEVYEELVNNWST